MGKWESGSDTWLGLCSCHWWVEQRWQAHSDEWPETAPLWMPTKVQCICVWVWYDLCMIVCIYTTVIIISLIFRAKLVHFISYLFWISFNYLLFTVQSYPWWQFTDNVAGPLLTGEDHVTACEWTWALWAPTKELPLVPWVYQWDRDELKTVWIKHTYVTTSYSLLSKFLHIRNTYMCGPI